MPITAEQRRQLNRKRRDGRAEEAYAAILGDLDAPMLGACISLREREDTKKAGTMAAPADALRYTECSLPALQRTLGKIQDKYGEGSGRLQEDGEGVFYDLGSGLGKACLQAAVCYPFEAVVGIEVLEGYIRWPSNSSSGTTKSASEALPPSQRRSEDDGQPIDVPDLEFRRGSFAGADLGEADVAFCHCAAFDKHTLKEAQAAPATLRPGAFAITVTHELPERLDFETVDSEILELDGRGRSSSLRRSTRRARWKPPPGDGRTVVLLLLALHCSVAVSGRCYGASTASSRPLGPVCRR